VSQETQPETHAQFSSGCRMSFGLGATAIPTGLTIQPTEAWMLSSYIRALSVGCIASPPRSSKMALRAISTRLVALPRRSVTVSRPLCRLQSDCGSPIGPTPGFLPVFGVRRCSSDQKAPCAAVTAVGNTEPVVLDKAKKILGQLPGVSHGDLMLLLYTCKVCETRSARKISKARSVWVVCFSQWC
jgi:hypothetical protein